MDISTFIIALVTSGIVSTIATYIFKNKELSDQRRWEIKRDACLEALKIVDTRFADYPWGKDGNKIEVDEQDFIPTSEIRSCFNRLILSCNDSSVPQNFEKCLYLKVDESDPELLTMDSVVDLRNSIRKELGFGEELKTRAAWITNINWHRKKKIKEPKEPLN